MRQLLLLAVLAVSAVGSVWPAPAFAADTPPAAGDGAHKPNRLATTSSPYLLQHAHNPVDWFPWGEAALEKARMENKLLIISVGYS
ncbi:MAG: DUF255 domain-containing protein, partial [Planctomycetaceae bacterium]|nr:DUF255 domain-containing protein [Planctomycetaceae bacterium]